MTSQKIHSYLIKKNQKGAMAHFFIKTILNSRRKYKVSWNINGQQAAAAQLTYGKESEFKIYCSMET
jgi:hypothetical protein